MLVLLAAAARAGIVATRLRHGKYSSLTRGQPTLAAKPPVGEEHVVAALRAERRRRAMGRYELDVVTERKEIQADRAEHPRLVAARNIRPVDRFRRCSVKLLAEATDGP